MIYHHRTVYGGQDEGHHGFDRYKQQLAVRARRDGIGERTIETTVPRLQLNSGVIQLDRAQPGNVANPNATPAFAPYRRKHVTPELIARGRAVYEANYPRLARIEALTGVDATIPISIFGQETHYGLITGGFDLLDALATLAYEGRRREFFENEFVAALRLLESGTPRIYLRGSWAGATGFPQFMPSAALRLAVDGDGDGRANIWSDQADALASIGNFLKHSGWRDGVHWGVAVRTPSDLNRRAIRNRHSVGRCPRVIARQSRSLSMRDWRSLGVVPIGRSLPDNELASLIEPDGPRSTAYLVTANYRAILAYNCSNFYALSVGLLADAITPR